MDVKWPLYRVEKNRKHGYVMGTFHLGERAMYPFPEVILSALEESSQLITELSDDETMLAGELLQKEALLLAGQTIDHLLSETGRAYLAARADEYNIALTDIETYRPWFIANYFSLDVYNNDFGKSSFFGVDNQLQRLAKECGLASIGLERANEQLATMIAAYPDTCADAIIQTIPTKADMEMGIEQMYEMYIRNDATNVAMSDAISELDASLTLERNQMWLPVIETAIQNDAQPFIAVGFGHLHGAGGLLDLLQTAGYHVHAEINS